VAVHQPADGDARRLGDRRLRAGLHPAQVPHAARPGDRRGARAAPPLLGWTAVTGSIDPGGLALFAILLVWQMPHFLAITLFRQADFARAGIQCVPVVRGELVTRVQAILWSIAPGADLPHAHRDRPHRHGCTAPPSRSCSASGSSPRLHRPRGLPETPAMTTRWARRFFFASLLYLPALIAALVADVLV
jgi:protoheme IX farnesyltransferase